MANDDPMTSAENRCGLDEERVAEPHGRDRPVTVLVVDDDSAWQVALAAWLAEEGFRVVGLSRGDRVTRAVETDRIDIVILDVHLPGLNGLDVLQALQHRWPRLPVIVMTAFGGAATADRARRLGATAYLDKPFRMTQLVNELHSIGRRCGWQPDG